MAGSKQHHVWQMIQRGFGEKKGKDHHVWVYRKHRNVKKTSTRLFGVEKYFYGPEGSDADTAISQYENKNQSTIQEIRKLENRTNIDPEFASSLICHLEMRSEFLRSEASEKFQKSINLLLENFRSPDILRKMMVQYLQDNPDKVDEFLGKSFIRPSQRPMALELLMDYLHNCSDKEILSLVENEFYSMEMLYEFLPTTAKEAHNKALSENSNFNERYYSHIDRRYYAWRVENGSFILPDTTLAFSKKNGASPVSQKGDIIDSVFLPLSSTLAIVGTKGEYDSRPLKTVNRILAGCSFDAFIAKENKEEFLSLTRRIGKSAEIISNREIQSVIKNICQSLEN